MVYWVSAWVLMVFHGSMTYSEPVKNEADCKRMLKFVEEKTLARAQCVEVTVMRKAL
jgi:hypothetical protein